jgi:HNH endonuclease
MGKEHISPKIKDELWKYHFGYEDEAKCLACQKISIHNTSFHAGHILAEKLCGLVELYNLLPICKGCNNRCGQQYLLDFTKEKNGIDIVLDDNYRKYQYRMENLYKIMRRKGNEKDKTVEMLEPIIDYLISNNKYKAKWSVDEYKVFVESEIDSPEYKSERTLILNGISINGTRYTRIHLKYQLLDGKCPETRYFIESEESQELPPLYMSGWIYHTKQSAHPKLSNSDSWVDMYKFYITSNQQPGSSSSSPQALP